MKESQLRVARSTATYIQEVPYDLPVEKPSRRTGSSRPFNAAAAADGKRVRSANEAARQAQPYNGVKRPSPSTLGKERAKLARHGKIGRKSLRIQSQGPGQAPPPTPTPKRPSHGPLGIINPRNMEFVVRAHDPRHFHVYVLPLLNTFTPRNYLATPWVRPLPMVGWSPFMQRR